MLDLGRDKHRLCRVKGSSCNENTGGHWRGSNVTAQMELLQRFKGSRMKHLLRSKAKTC